jgi:signal transduction histidine kinase
MRRFSHRSRLVLSTLLISGLVLALIFVGMGALFDRQAVENSRKDLQESLTQITSDLGESGNTPDLAEAHEAYPALTFVYLDASGRVLQKLGPGPAGSQLGFALRGVGDRDVMSDGIKLGDRTLIASLDWTPKRAELVRLWISLAVLWCLVQILVGGVSWYAAAATFKPLHDLTEQAAAVSGSDLTARLHSHDSAEFGAFAAQLNLLLERIEATAKREEQFASDAAHELRTPLTTLLAGLETGLLRDRTPEEYRTLLASLVPEVERLSRLVELLLSSARSNLEPAAPVDLKPVIEKAATRWRDRFEDSGVHLEYRLESVCSAIRPEEVDSVLDNLLENALRYSPRGTTSRVELSAVGGEALIQVSDEGPGIPPELMAVIFDRLMTGESSRSRIQGGFGIGLSICQSIVLARQGRISVRNTSPGACFSVHLTSA